MRHFIKWQALCCLILLVGMTVAAKPSVPREVTGMDKNWKFMLGNPSGAEAVAFNDAGWRTLDVPHDWSAEGQVDEQNPTGSGGAYFPAGIGWYRKTFEVPANWEGKQVYIEFDGIMANSEVWINGVSLGKRPYGYIVIRYDMTPHLKFGAANVLAVKADNADQPASRWYAGAGIYRHTRMIAVDPVHVDLAGGVFVSTPQVSASAATVSVQTTVQNGSGASADVTVTTAIQNPAGKVVATDVSKAANVAAGQSGVITQSIEVSSPALWNLDSPNLYTAVTTVKSGTNVLDEVTTVFGIRSARFEAATGFWLNDKNLKIKGVCLHQDAGAVGVAVPLSVWRKRFENLKKLGVNGIRCAHNPVDPGFLDLCDEMGFVVMVETFDTWLYAKKPYDYHLFFEEWWDEDTRDVVLRDRNHPSVVIYSVGNEIRENLNSEAGLKLYLDQQNLMHEYDPTRPVTMALFRPNTQRVYDNGFADKMDVVGQNYRDNELEAAWKQNPNRKVLGTENAHSRQTWLYLRDQPYLAGQFLWPGIDYTGESQWPQIYFNSGLISRTNVIKVAGLERQSWWAEQPVVSMSRQEARSAQIDWTPSNAANGTEQAVNVYSNCEQVEVFLNGKSQGVKPKNTDDSAIQYRIPYEPGELKAVGMNGGKAVAEFTLKSAGQPVKLVLVPEGNEVQNDFEDVNFVRAYVADAAGNRYPYGNYDVQFEIEGAGEIFATDNSDPNCHEMLKSTKHAAYLGECVALIKATADKGKITVKASAAGLEPASVTLKAVK